MILCLNIFLIIHKVFHEFLPYLLGLNREKKDGLPSNPSSWYVCLLRERTRCPVGVSATQSSVSMFVPSLRTVRSPVLKGKNQHKH
jgi:hypothetical protein